MDLSLVIVTHNQHDVLRTCLHSARVAMQGIEGEIIVVDNASVDGTPEMMAAEFGDMRYLRNPVNVHYTRAVNQGTRATTGRYVFLLNDDTELAPDTFRKLIDFMDAHPRCGVVGPVIKSPQGVLQNSGFRFPTPFREVMEVTGLGWWLRNFRFASGWLMYYPLPMGTQRVDWVCGGMLFARRIAFEQMGLHDETYLFYRDDPDVGMQMRKAGWEVWYCADTVTLHHHGVSTVKTPRKVRFDLIGIRSRRHYHRKFHGLSGMATVEIAYAAMDVVRGIKAYLTGKRDEARQRFRRVGLQFEAGKMPREEIEAIEAYRTMAYNGQEAGPALRGSPAFQQAG